MGCANLTRRTLQSTNRLINSERIKRAETLADIMRTKTEKIDISNHAVMQKNLDKINKDLDDKILMKKQAYSDSLKSVEKHRIEIVLVI